MKRVSLIVASKLSTNININKCKVHSLYNINGKKWERRAKWSSQKRVSFLKEKIKRKME